MEDNKPNLKRFLNAQKLDYHTAYAEIKTGGKRSHWMWYIFPQIAGLGYSVIAQRFAIKDMEEAKYYLAHPVLGRRLIEISNAVLQIPRSNATQVMGSPDDLKLNSSMTLFALVPSADPIFEEVIKKFLMVKKIVLLLD